MEILIASAIGLLTACGIRLICEARSFPVLIGATLLSHAVNLFLFATGHIVRELPPIIGMRLPGSTDPLPQALVLTAIVISFGMTAVVAAMAVGARTAAGHDRIEPATRSGDPATPAGAPVTPSGDTLYGDAAPTGDAMAPSAVATPSGDATTPSASATPSGDATTPSGDAAPEHGRETGRESGGRAEDR